MNRPQIKPFGMKIALLKVVDVKINFK